MLAKIPVSRFDQLDHLVWKTVVGRRLWQADKEALTEWVETQRANKLAILVRINEGISDHRKWPPSNMAKLKRLVKEVSVLDDATSAEAVFLLDYFGAASVKVSARDDLKYLVSTSQGDQFHLLTDKFESELQKRLQSVNQIELLRR